MNDFVARLAGAVLCVCAIACGSVPALAQAWPEKPLRMVIPFPPGGSNDIIGRVVAQALGERIGKAVVVDNRPGAGGIIGADIAAKAAPDGYTILLISSAFAMNSSLHKLSYDPRTAFAPIAMLGSAPSVVTVHAAIPVATLADLIGFLKAQPGKVRMASAGVGSYQHLVSEQFRLMTGTDFLIVQYKGGGPALNDLVAGHVDFSVGTIIQTLPFIASGQVKALAIAGAKRIAALPDVPTVAEAGLPGYDASNWWGLLAPAATPGPIVDRLSREVAALLDAPEIVARFTAEGAEAVRKGPAEFAQLIAEETTKWARVVKDANIKSE